MSRPSAPCWRFSTWRRPFIISIGRPGRRGRAAVLRHVRYWGALHQRLATAPLTKFDWLSEDRLVQRAVYRVGDEEVAITVNFGVRPRQGLPPLSARVRGLKDGPDEVYSARGAR